MTFTTNSKTNVTAKADEVETLNKTRNESKRGLGQRLDKMAKPELQVPPHLHFATAFTIFILIFNYILLDHSDNHFSNFTPKTSGIVRSLAPYKSKPSFGPKCQQQDSQSLNLQNQPGILRIHLTYLLRTHTGTS
jgi:hypothetical protein